ncbi:tellurite resistance TerB family protein [Microvirga terricola]|uniref:Tellurite resistance TerB family protein n=1 Tax=Microvirga terricola TaxID=2719797 RepID=A0ABX0VB22_9HYPH|nr:tellurite resistance TerB family protein [Microvirga terricola]NIX77050.1 tellurite resistance TerB family protein [Microvirga terricola]
MSLGAILENLLAGQGKQGSAQQPGSGQQRGNPDPQGDLSDLASKIPGGLGALAGGGLLSLILGSKAGRSAGGSLLKAGGLAVLTSVAFKAYQDWQARQMPDGNRASLPPPAPSGSGFHLDEEKVGDGGDMRLALIQAMVSAAKSDGHLDSGEINRIQNQIQQLGLGNEATSRLLDMMSKPADPAVIAGLPQTKEQAAGLYVASRMAIGIPDTPEEKAYLERLISLMGLPADLVAHLDTQVDSARKVAA